MDQSLLLSPTLSTQQGIVGQVCQDGLAVSLRDITSHPKFDEEIDLAGMKRLFEDLGEGASEMMRLAIFNMLYLPIFDTKLEVIAVLQVANKMCSDLSQWNAEILAAQRKWYRSAEASNSSTSSITATATTATTATTTTATATAISILSRFEQRRAELYFAFTEEDESFLALVAACAGNADSQPSHEP